MRVAIAICLASLAGRAYAADSCAAFRPLPEPTAPVFWDQWLSLAACLDASPAVDAVDRPDQLAPMVGQLEDAQRPAMLMYYAALERAPSRDKLAAAYHVGNAALGMLTRARSLIAADPSSPRARAMRAQLEDRLAPIRKLAWFAFASVESQVAADPQLDSDVVAHCMIVRAVDAMRMLEAPPESIDAVQAAR